VSRTLPALALLLALTGCSVGATPAADGGGAGEISSSAGFPVTVDNCGTELTLDRAPRRVLLINNDEVGTLEALGALDRVVAVTADLQEGLYAESTYAALGDLGLLSTDTTATGGSVVSQESILATAPDLVIAPENAVDRAALASAGIATYVPAAYCADPGPELSGTATFDRAWSEVRALGTVLGVPDRAERVVADARAELDGAERPDAGSAAAVYVSSGGTVLSPYGGPSMVTPVFEAAGLRNVYADVDERVFDVSLEDLLARDPRTVVLLTSGSAQETREAFLSSPGVDRLSAVREGRVVVLPFPYTDPPSVLSAQGPAQLAALLADLD
jgi:iron complex transport system substrate-binding protein